MTQSADSLPHASLKEPLGGPVSPGTSPTDCCERDIEQPRDDVSELHLEVAQQQGPSNCSGLELTAMAGIEINPPAPKPAAVLPRLCKFSVAVAFALAAGMACPGFTSSQGEAQRCFGLLVFVSICWAAEPIPSHVTALTVPVLVLLCRVMRVPGFDSEALVPADSAAQLPLDDNSRPSPGDPMNPTAAAVVISASFFDPVIMLFISGFTMAAAMDKHHISARIALLLLRRAGSRPSRILLAIMALSVILSMFLSNVAAAVLLSAVVRPVLRELPEQSSWPKTVLLGIAFSCNLGGMSSPIASPQNVFAISMLKRAKVDMPFLSWCQFSIPFVLLSGLGLWLFLRKSFKTSLPNGVQYSFDSSALPPLGALHLFVMIVVVLTIGLWSVFDTVQPIFGNMGIVGLVPVVLFYGMQLLTISDFNSMPWSVLILMGGGLALGNAVESSGLLDILAVKIQDMLAGRGLWLTAFVFNLVTAVIANFLSSTVCAVIMLPVIVKVGVQLGHARLLVVSVAIMTSGAMGLPVSSFPNANSCSMTTERGTPILSTFDYIRTGLDRKSVV